MSNGNSMRHLCTARTRCAGGWRRREGTSPLDRRGWRWVERTRELDLEDEAAPGRWRRSVRYAACRDGGGQRDVESGNGVRARRREGVPRHGQYAAADAGLCDCGVMAMVLTRRQAEPVRNAGLLRIVAANGAPGGALERDTRAMVQAEHLAGAGAARELGGETQRHDSESRCPYRHRFRKGLLPEAT
jgi:hypothetical protein